MNEVENIKSVARICLKNAVWLWKAECPCVHQMDYTAHGIEAFSALESWNTQLLTLTMSGTPTFLLIFGGWTDHYLFWSVQKLQSGPQTNNRHCTKEQRSWALSQKPGVLQETTESLSKMTNMNRAALNGTKAGDIPVFSRSCLCVTYCIPILCWDWWATQPTGICRVLWWK